MRDLLKLYLRLLLRLRLGLLLLRDLTLGNLL
jgi:hypothetical protein